MLKNIEKKIKVKLKRSNQTAWKKKCDKNWILLNSYVFWQNNSKAI